MAIQKFKHGQEITSAKLNEIVSFLNTLESTLANAEDWNENVGGKLDGFTETLNSLKTQVEGLLSSAENLDTLLQAYLDLKSTYEQLVTENVNNLLEGIFSPSNITIDPNGIVIIGGISTGYQIATLKGDTGAQGLPGVPGLAGTNGNTLHTGTFSNINDISNIGVDGDLFFNPSLNSFYKKNNGTYTFLTNVKGSNGSPGAKGGTTLIQYKYKSNQTDTPTNEPTLTTKYLLFKTYLDTDSISVINAKPFTEIKIRGESFYPVISQEEGEIILSWTSTEQSPNPPAPINIKGDPGEDGEDGADGTSVTILGSFAAYTNLPSTGQTLGDGYLIAGYLWVYTGAANAGTPPAVGSVYNGFINVGLIQGPQGVQGPIGLTGPTGPQGTRGNKIFVVPDSDSLPLSTTFGSYTLIIDDTFIIQDSGLIKRVDSLSPFSLIDVYQLPPSNELIYTAKLLEAVTKGDLIQYVKSQGDHKEVAKASQVNRLIGSDTVLNCNDNPELVLGIAMENGSNNQFIKILAWGTLVSMPASFDTIPAGTKLWFDASGSIPGALTSTEPVGNLYARILTSVYLAGAGKVLQVRVGEAKKKEDIKGLQTALDLKANLISPALTGTPTAPTASAVTNTTQIATTAFVQTAITNKVPVRTLLATRTAIGSFNVSALTNYEEVECVLTVSHETISGLNTSVEEYSISNRVKRSYFSYWDQTFGGINEKIETGIHIITVGATANNTSIGVFRVRLNNAMYTNLEIPSISGTVPLSSWVMEVYGIKY